MQPKGIEVAKRLCDEIKKVEQFDSELVETANQLLDLIDVSPADANYLLGPHIGAEIMNHKLDRTKGIEDVRAAHMEVVNYLKENYEKDQIDCATSKYFKPNTNVFACPRY